MHVELVKKRWVYANKECTLNTAITVRACVRVRACACACAVVRTCMRVTLTTPPPPCRQLISPSSPSPSSVPRRNSSSNSSSRRRHQMAAPGRRWCAGRPWCRLTTPEPSKSTSTSSNQRRTELARLRRQITCWLVTAINWRSTAGIYVMVSLVSHVDLSYSYSNSGRDWSQTRDEYGVV